MTTTTAPTCWADGYGRWHCTLTIPGHPITGGVDHFLADARRTARKAMLAELAAREGANFAPETIAATLIERDGMTFHFAELATSDLRSQAARDAASTDYGTESYWHGLDEGAERMAAYFTARGEHDTAAAMFTRSLTDALRGNDGD